MSVPVCFLFIYFLEASLFGKREKERKKGGRQKEEKEERERETDGWARGRKGAEGQDVFRKPYGKRKVALHRGKRYNSCL